jgi:hypothetical protein
VRQRTFGVVETGTASCVAFTRPFYRLLLRDSSLVLHSSSVTSPIGLLDALRGVH